MMAPRFGPSACGGSSAKHLNQSRPLLSKNAQQRWLRRLSPCDDARERAGLGFSVFAGNRVEGVPLRRAVGHFQIEHRLQHGASVHVVGIPHGGRVVGRAFRRPVEELRQLVELLLRVGDVPDGVVEQVAGHQEIALLRKDVDAAAQIACPGNIERRMTRPVPVPVHGDVRAGAGDAHLVVGVREKSDDVARPGLDDAGLRVAAVVRVDEDEVVFGQQAEAEAVVVREGGVGRLEVRPMLVARGRVDSLPGERTDGNLSYAALPVLFKRGVEPLLQRAQFLRECLSCWLPHDEISFFV